jgi:hypothetical protein
VCQRRASLRAIVLCCSILSLFSTFGKTQDSAADAARRNREKNAQTAPKKVWTNDDLPPANGLEPPSNAAGTQESDSEILRQFRLLSKEELAAAVLKRAGAPNADFPDRKDWEQRLFEAKQSWMDQVDRMEGHKDSSKVTQEEEMRLAQGAQRIFDRIAGEGILQARAVNDPALKARLDYKRQLEFCMHVSGEAHDTCMAALEQLKWKMQKEGTW